MHKPQNCGPSPSRDLRNFVRNGTVSYRKSVVCHVFNIVDTFQLISMWSFSCFSESSRVTL